jgi:hypothetical protein
MKMLSRIGFCMSLLMLSFPVQAGEVEHAEHIRLQEEMKKLAARNAWHAVEAAYQKMLALEGEVLTYEDHWLGAQAARDAGNATAWKARLKAAQAQKDTSDVQASLSEVGANYGSLLVAIDPKNTESCELKAAAIPFAPDQVANIRFVANQIKALKSFDGLLVQGNYTLTCKEKGASEARVETFTISPAGARPSFEIGTKPEAETSIALRLGAGGSFMAGVASGEGTGPATIAGPGARAELGLEIGIGSRLFLFGIGGYNLLVSSASVDGQALAGLPPTMAHLAGGWFGVGVHIEQLSFGAGPTAGFLSARAPVLLENELFGVSEPVTASLSSGAFGGAVLIGYDFATEGKNRVGLAVEGGAAIADRPYPWASLSLVFLPVLGS